MEEEKKRITYNTILTSITVIYFLASFCFESLFNIFEKIAIYIAPIIMLLYIVINIKTILKKNKNILIILLFAIGFIVMGSLANKTGIGSLGQMITILLIFFTFPFVKTSKKFMKKLKWIIVILYFFFMQSTKTYMNPNYAGYLYFLYYLLFITLFILKNQNYRKSTKLILFIMFTLLSIYNINITKCRSALIGIAMIFLCNLVPYRIYEKKENRKIIAIIMTIGSLVFTYIYILMWKNNFRIDLSFFTQKSLYSGRHLIWLESFSLLKKNPIFGVGSKYTLSSQPAYALHNTMHTITLTFGIPNLICLFFIILKCLNNTFLVVKEKSILRFIYSIMFSLFIIDYFESYLHWTQYNIIFFIIITLCISNDEGEREK